jgi:hypothetical protein
MKNLLFGGGGKKGVEIKTDYMACLKNAANLFVP